MVPLVAAALALLTLVLLAVLVASFFIEPQCGDATQASRATEESYIAVPPGFFI
jgi:hypothetical protein